MEQDYFISSVLREFAKLEPSASKKLTKSIPKGERGTKASKIKKVEFIVSNHQDTFKKIAVSILGQNHEATNPLGLSSNSLLNSIMPLITDEPVSGSFGVGYGYGQGEVE